MFGSHIFKSQVGMFDPVALQDHYVAIRYLANIYYRKVVFLESIPPFEAINVGALGANATAAVANVTRMELPDDEFGLFRWFPIDPISYRVNLPRGIDKHALKNITIPIDQKTMEWDPNLVSTELAVWEDNRPGVLVTNMTARAIQDSRIIAMGYRFTTEVVTDKMMANMPAPSWWTEKNIGKPWNLLEALKCKAQPSTDVWCTGRSI